MNRRLTDPRIINEPGGDPAKRSEAEEAAAPRRRRTEWQATVYSRTSKLIAVTGLLVVMSMGAAAQTPPNEPSRLRFMLTGSPYQQRTHGRCPVCGRFTTDQPCPCVIRPEQLSFWQNAGFLVSGGVYGVQPEALPAVAEPLPAESVAPGPVVAAPPANVMPFDGSAHASRTFSRFSTDFQSLGHGLESFGDGINAGMNTRVSGNGHLVYTGENGLYTPPNDHTSSSAWDFNIYAPNGRLVGQEPMTTVDSQNRVNNTQANGSNDPASAQGTFRQGYLETRTTERGTLWRVTDSTGLVDGNYNPRGPGEMYYVISRSAITDKQAVDTRKFDAGDVYYDPATELYYIQMIAAPDDSESRRLDSTGRTLQDIVESAVPGTVTFISNESSIDPATGSARFVYNYEIPEIAFAPNLLGRVKISENMSVIPRTRFILDYSFSSDVPVTNGKANVNRLTPGVEWAFMKNNRASLEMRIPIGWTANCYQALDGTGKDDTGTIGDITFNLKFLLKKTNRLATSAGLGISLPTAKDRGITNGAFPSRSLFELENKTVHLMPFFGILYAPDDTVFAQAYAQVDIAACKSDVLFYDYVDSGSMRKFGTWDECTYVYLSGILGRWLYRDPTKYRGLTGVNVSAELHYTTTLGNPKDVTGRFYSPDMQSIENITIARRKNESYLNLTFGTRLLINRKSNVGFAFCVPLFDQKQFTYETRISWNRCF